MGVIKLDKYIELLTKIKDAVIPPTTDGFIETFKHVGLAGVLVTLIACIVFMVSDNLGKISKFSDFIKGTSILVAIVSMSTAIIMTICMVLYPALIQNELSRESNVAISNYVYEMNDQDYSRLERLVKLYGNNLSSNDKTIKQVNKHLMETIGK